MNTPRVSVREVIVVLFSVALSVSAHSQWSRTSGSEGGFAAALLNMPGYMLIGLESGGVYKSTDEGLTWQYASSGLTGEGPGGYAFAATGERVYVSTGVGIGVSVNGGATWTPANDGLPVLGAYVVGFALRNAGIFCGVSGGGVYWSPDSGAHWSRTPASPADTNVSRDLLHGCVSVCRDRREWSLPLVRRWRIMATGEYRACPGQRYAHSQLCRRFGNDHRRNTGRGIPLNR